MANLDRAYKQLLKSLLVLQEGTAVEAVYILFRSHVSRSLAAHQSFVPIQEHYPTRLGHHLRRLALRQAAFPSGERYGWLNMVLVWPGNI